MSILSPIPADKQGKRGWRLTLDGKPIEPVSHLVLTNANFGTLEYGATPQGYDAWCFEEKGGGGSVIVPWCIYEGQLLVGLVEQNRYTMGAKVWNVPRGFLKADEKHFQTASREAGEELEFNLAKRFMELAGNPTNPNSAFFVTLTKDKGVRYYGLRILPEELEPIGEGAWQFRKDVLKPAPEAKVAEQIFGSKFVAYDAALWVSDQFTQAGIGRLLGMILPKQINWAVS